MAVIKLNKRNPAKFSFVGLVYCGAHGTQAAFAKQTGIYPGGFTVPSSDVQIFTVPADRLQGANVLSSLHSKLRAAALTAFKRGLTPKMCMADGTLYAGSAKLGDSRVGDMFFGEVPLSHASGYREPSRIGGVYKEPSLVICAA